MGQLHGVQPQPRFAPNQPIEIQNHAEIRPALHNARTGGTPVGRILAGIFTLGISEGIRAIVLSVRSRQTETPHVIQPQQPAPPRINVQNRELASQLKAPIMPAAYAAAFQEALTELRAAFGEEVLPQMENFAALKKALPNTLLFDRIERFVKNSPEEVTPQRLKELILDQKPLLTNMALHICCQNYCTAHNYKDLNTIAPISTCITSNAARKERLDQCTTMTDVQALFESCEELPQMLELTNAINTGQRNAQTQMFTTLAQRTELPESILKETMDLKTISSKFTYLGVDIQEGKIPAAEIQQRFLAITEKFVQAKLSLIEAIEALPLPDQAKIAWKNDTLRLSDLEKKAEFLKFVNAGLNTDGSQIVTYIRDGAVSAPEVFGLLSTLAMHTEDNLRANFTPLEWNELGGDGQGTAHDYATQAALYHTPGLLEALVSLPEDIKKEVQELGQQFLRNGFDRGAQGHMSKAITDLVYVEKNTGIFITNIFLKLTQVEKETPKTLAEELSTSELSLAHTKEIAAGLAGIREQFGEASLPAGNILSSWNNTPQGAGILQKAQEQIRQMRHNPTPQEVGGLTREIARQSAAEYVLRTTIQTIARTREILLEDDQLSPLVESLYAHHPELREKVIQAHTKDDIHALLDGVTDLMELCQAMAINEQPGSLSVSKTAKSV